jgi:hypothetical protein
MPRKRPPDQEFARTVALALPETTEASHMGRPDLRVRNKIFATLPQDGRSVNLKVTPVNLDALTSARPATFADVWDGRWMGVTLANIERAELRDLVIDAWKLAAPKRLVAAYEKDNS